MPYQTNAQLPDDIKENMPKEAQDTFRMIFNDASRRYQDESIAFATAYAALKRTGWKQDDNGKWIKESKGEKELKKLSAEERTPPRKAQENAKKVLRWKDEHGDEVDAMTQTGWRRANQLADGKPLSMDIISRMAQFKRHKKNSEIAEEYKGTPWKDNGYVAWLGWGGHAGVNWANRLTNKVDKSESENKFLKRDDKQRYTLGVVYEPYEIDSQGDFAEPEEIEKGAWRFMAKLQGQSKLTKRKLEIVDSITKALEQDEQIRLDVTELLDTVEKGKGLNDMHVNTPLDEKLGTIVESYIAPIDFTIETPRGKEEVKKGSWLMGVIWNEDYFEKIEDGERTGYSMEGSGKRIDVNIDE